MLCEECSYIDGLTEMQQLTSSLVEERLQKPTQTRDMLNNFMKLREANPDKLSTREITGSLYINLYVEFGCPDSLLAAHKSK
jgi:cytochrome P450